MGFSGERWVLFVFVLVVLGVIWFFDVGAANFWEFVVFLLAFLRFYILGLCCWCSPFLGTCWELFGNQLGIPWMCLAHFRELFRFLWELARFLWG